jgi:hypothetical protein
VFLLLDDSYALPPIGMDGLHRCGAGFPDEALGALDDDTGSAVMHAFHTCTGTGTILTIAHG